MIDEEELKREGVGVLTPDLPDEILTDLRKSPRLQAARDELRSAAKVAAVLAGIRQRKLYEANAQIERAFVDGMGAHIACIDPEIYARMELMYGRGCWRDKAFLNDTLKKNPQLRIKCGSRKTMIPVNGLRDNPTGKPAPKKELILA